MLAGDTVGGYEIIRQSAFIAEPHKGRVLHPFLYLTKQLTYLYVQISEVGLRKKYNRKLCNGKAASLAILGIKGGESIA